MTQVKYYEIPICPSPTAIEEIATKMKVLNNPYKIVQLANGCMNIEAGTPTFTDAQQAPVDCSPVRDSATGITSYSCQKQNASCPPIDSSAESACLSYGGRALRVSYNNCPYVTCDLSGGISTTPDAAVSLLDKPTYDCPNPQALLTFVDACEGQGLEARLVKENACPRVQCAEKEDERKYVCPKPSAEEQKRLSESCTGKLVEGFDAQGCGVLACAGAGNTNSCLKEVPTEAVSKCAQDNGKMTALTNEEGCITFSYCTQTNEGEKVVVVRDDITPAQMKRFLEKLTGLQNEIEETRTRTGALADYYLEKRPLRANELRAASKQLESVLAELKDIITLIEDHTNEGLPASTAAGIATQLVGFKATLNNALNLMLSAGENNSFCSDGDFECFRKGIQNCSVGTSVRFSTIGAGYGARIDALNEDGCAFTIEKKSNGETQTMSCVHPDYETGELDSGIMQKICTTVFDELTEDETTAAGAGEETSSSTETTATASGRISPGSMYSFTKYPGCRETLSTKGEIMMVCPLATKNAIQPYYTPISGLFGLVSALGGK